jgi:hypothetical protein
MMFSYALYVALSAVYLAVIPSLYHILAVGAGTAPPYPEMVTEGATMLRMMFCVTVFFWGVLWGVKITLLFIFRRLIMLLPRYIKIWWFVFIFTVLTFVGCFISNFTSCASMHAWFTLGNSTLELRTFFSADFS